ncbi:DUF2478 domain-containing protein [Rhodovulum euryhalinum]|uniref:Uncharacterized protein DUF2478 n=1 Tax=Rhodovulum euryhalinum TaxID=35805 RepID=A0A4R2KJ34_9RHOB|nr:DUF2478 domain-containing protein [Rhodovulum euryhalinum]TCO73244.1 uncharacterized protein DUF2478 [Rhodovulum euryhalinum]
MAGTDPFPFDAECDIAAVTYGPGEPPDALIAAFVSRLTDPGYRVAGMVQRGACRDGHIGREVTLFPWEERLILTDAHDPRFAGIETRIMGVLDLRPDLVVLNRFGWLERCGGGWRRVIARAMDLGLPVLVPVPQVIFRDWLDYTGGLSVRLSGSAPALEDWWQSMRSEHLPGTRQNWCMTLK